MMNNPIRPFTESLKKFLIDMMGQKEYDKIEHVVSENGGNLETIWREMASEDFAGMWCSFFEEKLLRELFLIFDAIFKTLTDRNLAQKLMGLLLVQLIFEWGHNQEHKGPITPEFYADYIASFNYDMIVDGKCVNIISPSTALVLVIYFFIIRAALMTNAKGGASNVYGSQLLNRYLPYMYGIGNIVHRRMESGHPNDSKYGIEAMIYRYNAMFQAFSYEPALNQYFLTSEEIRRAMVTEGWFMITEDNKQSVQYHIGKLVMRDRRKKLAGLLENLRTIVYENGEQDQPAKFFLDKILFWPGVGMTIPDSARITLTFNNPYASFYYKSINQHYNSTSGSIPLNVYLQEAPSSMSFAISDSKKVFINDESFQNLENTGSLGPEWEGVMDFSNPKNHILNAVQGSISKSRLQKNATKNNQDYKEFHFEIKPPGSASEYELIVELPYLLPQVDVLSKTVITTGDDASTTIVLSSC